MSTENRWIKASASSSNGSCVELLPETSGVAVRDSKDPDGPQLHFTRDELAAWIDGAKNGEFDHLID